MVKDIKVLVGCKNNVDRYLISNTLEAEIAFIIQETMKFRKNSFLHECFYNSRERRYKLTKYKLQNPVEVKEINYIYEVTDVVDFEYKGTVKRFGISRSPFKNIKLFEEEKLGTYQTETPVELRDITMKGLFTFVNGKRADDDPVVEGLKESVKEFVLDRLKLQSLTDVRITLYRLQESSDLELSKNEKLLLNTDEVYIVNVVFRKFTETIILYQADEGNDLRPVCFIPVNTQKALRKVILYFQKNKIRELKL